MTTRVRPPREYPQRRRAGMSLSLLRQKQIQWAKEKEELKHFGGLWGGIWNTEERRYRPCIRSQYKSNLELPIHREEDNLQRKRTPSLPPINSNYEPSQQQPQEEECNGDTSGYASDSAGNEYNAEVWTKSGGWPLPQFPRRTPDSISSGSGREERARWGDRGVGVGHLWEPSSMLPPPPLPKVQPATPNWLNRAPQERAEVLVISHSEENMTSTPTSSRETIRTCDTPFSSEDSQRSFTRGQNVPIGSAELAERERKRQKALEHQNAIKKQLEEKERIKREEQERNEREERLAEERLKKQQELERQRLEEERRRQKEKEEKDERIAKAMAEALEQAERAAKEEKARARRKHLPDLHVHEQPIEQQEIQVHHAQVQHAPEHIPEVPKLVMQETPLQQQLQLPPPPTEQQEIEVVKVPSTPKQALPVPPLIKLERPQREAFQSGEEEQEVELSVRVERLEIEAQDLRVVPPPGRLLTPSRYRAARSVERSTQTESSGRTKVMRRFLRLEERPKWGVNRPTTQYVKASDRDPFRRSRHPVRTSPRDSSSRSPSPLENSKASFNSVSSLGKSNATYTVGGSRRSMKVTRGVCTPRVMQVIPTGGIIRKSSAGKRIISIRGNFGNNGTKRLHLPQDTENVLPKKIEVSEFLSVNQVLSQLIDLKHGLQMKQKEWEITRSPTPFSEMSFKT